MKFFIALILAMMALPAVSSDQSVECLLTNAYYEARGEGTTGILLVSKVVMNRSEKTGKSICDVLKVRGQFSWKGTRKKVPESFKKEYREVVRNLYEGKIEVPYKFSNVFYYHSVKVKPAWGKFARLVGTYGNHRFYKGV